MIDSAPYFKSFSQKVILNSPLLSLIQLIKINLKNSTASKHRRFYFLPTIFFFCSLSVLFCKLTFQTDDSNDILYLVRRTYIYYYSSWTRNQVCLFCVCDSTTWQTKLSETNETVFSAAISPAFPSSSPT